jgi:hypothetical protein
MQLSLPPPKKMAPCYSGGLSLAKIGNKVPYLL